jgi:adenosylcobinamide-GDP ribazoletransferase
VRLIDAAMRHELRLFFVALQFLTRLPVPRWVGHEPEWLNQSARHFPLVGALVGAAGATVLWGAGTVFPPAVAVGLSMAATLVLTGAFHEDGLADTFDALGGAVSRERALAIMKDSRIGSYGATALVIVLGLKAAALAAMPLALAVPALLIAHTASRAAAVLLIRRLD